MGNLPKIGRKYGAIPREKGKEQSNTFSKKKKKRGIPGQKAQLKEKKGALRGSGRNEKRPSKTLIKTGLLKARGSVSRGGHGRFPTGGRHQKGYRIVSRKRERKTNAGPRGSLTQKKREIRIKA